MADKGKVFMPGVVGLTNYRSRFNRPVYGTIVQGTRAGSPNTRRRFNRYRYQYRPVNPVRNPIGAGIQQYSPTYTMTMVKRKKKKQYKSVCCRYVKGKKVCKPKYCPKKRYYRKKFYW